MIWLKAIFLFLGIMFTFVNYTKYQRGQTISGLGFILQTAGWAGFIVCQWLI
jgi:hypothetical protein